jgi:hypothetical protein
LFAAWNVHQLRLRLATTDALEARLSGQLRQAPAAVPRSSPEAALLPALATASAINRLNDDLHAQAASHQLTVTAAITGERQQLTAQLGRVDVTVKLRGTYSQFKDMLGMLLAAHNGLAVQQMTIRHLRPADPVVDVDLQMSYFYRNS